MIKEDNKTILSRVRDKIDGGVNRLLVTLAFAGCVNALSAKTITGIYKSMDGTKTEILDGGKKYQIESNALCLAVSNAGRKRGGEVFVTVEFDENTSRVKKAVISHSPIRVTSGISNIKWDIGNIIDDVNEGVGNARDFNIGRVIGNIGNAVDNYAPSVISCDGIVRVRAASSTGGSKWAQYHTVENGRLKPEYDPSLTRTDNNTEYTQSSSTNTTQYQGTSTTSSQSPNVHYVQSRYR